jgi:hypothetical protein
MKYPSTTLTAAFVLALCGCASTGQPTAWGKPGVSRIDFGTDLGMCTGLAAQSGYGSGANTAGGVQGTNSSPMMDRERGSTVSPRQDGGPTPASQAATSANLPSTGSYSGMASSDYAQRAATQQRAQEMTAKRAQSENLKHCLGERGYREFTLTPEQRARLGTLKTGSNEYYEYLYKLGSDPANTARAR